TAGRRRARKARFTSNVSRRARRRSMTEKPETGIARELVARCRDAQADARVAHCQAGRGRTRTAPPRHEAKPLYCKSTRDVRRSCAERRREDESMEMNPVVKGMIRSFSRLHMSLFRWLGTAGPGAFRNTLILTTRGRKTGREVATPLLYVEEDGKLFIVASFGGSDTPPGWYLNLSANPDVSVESKNGSRSYRARSLRSEEAGKVWPKLLALYPTYASYQKKTTRVIPVVELTPI